jgi:hypothetical protein
MHKKIKDVQCTGFAINAAEPGEKAKITIKHWAISNSDLFYIYAEQIANAIFFKLDYPSARSVINRYLAIIHQDASADIYLDDFKIISKIKIKRPMNAGDFIYAQDVEDISEVRFPDIPVNIDDKVIFLVRNDWRFGIYFDFTQNIDIDKMAIEIAEFHKALIFENTLDDMLAKLKEKTDIVEANIITEGKTDVMHLEKALKIIGFQRSLRYLKPDVDLGDKGLLELCRKIKLVPHDKPIICIFDRDNLDIQRELHKQMDSGQNEYQIWGNNVFSFILPVPDGRREYKNICIEMYYSNDVMQRFTSDGKRLYFSNEIKMEKTPDNNIRYIPTKPLDEYEFTKKIFSTDVDRIIDESGRKRGISKTVFADLISNEVPPFVNIDFNNFRYIADIIEKILSDTNK